MRKINLNAILMSALLISPMAMAESPVLAEINNKSITEEDFQSYVQARIGVKPGENLPAAKRQELMDEIINRELIYQQSVKEGFDKDPEIKALIAEQTRNVITSRRINKLINETPISEEELKAVYQEQVSSPASTEYKARHILLKTENDAKNIIAELKKGADFAKLAGEKSTGPSATVGGDLGWFSANQMVKPFADAVAKLEPGEYTKRATETRFGWHVILLEEKRQIDPPPFESIERQLRTIVQNQIISDYLDKLKEANKVVIK